MEGQLVRSERKFQSTPSVWRETVDLSGFDATATEFQSTPSVWRETFYSAMQYNIIEDFNPLPPCGGRLLGRSRRVAQRKISIHSLRVEGDHIR